jgi:predicted nucleic acid-binding protein
MVAIDTSVLIDLLGDDARADAAEGCVRDALAHGPVVLCDVVVSEITAGLGHGAEIMDVVEEMGMSYLAVERRSAIRAGEMQRRYKERLRLAAAKDARPAAVQRTVPDFIVGAHALLQCSALITRDAGFFRDYFKGLKVIVPKAS